MKSQTTRGDEGSRSYARGMEAYDRGDWKTARAHLRDAAEGQGRKQDRVRAGQVVSALSADGFALKLAAGLALLYIGLLLWIIL